MKRRPPPHKAFRRFADLLNQDAFVLYGPTPEHWFAAIFEGTPRPELESVLDHVEHLLSDPYTEADLEAYWRTTWADLSPRGKNGYRTFFALVRDYLRRRIDASGS